MMNENIKDMEPLFADMVPLLKNFKKNTYADLFASYIESNKRFFEDLNKTIDEKDDADFQEFVSEFSDAVTALAAGKMEQIDGKTKRENLQVSLNMFMAVYFLPAVRQGRQSRAIALTENICEKWAGKFHDSPIKSADYGDIVSGFKSKLCYVTTAVCKCLHKPEDCYELKLLKDFRDQSLMQTKEGEELVLKYYDIAPTIVKRIDKSENAEEKYRFLWENYLKPCISYIEDGRLEECGETYIRMMEDLQKQYIITAQPRSKDKGEVTG